MRRSPVLLLCPLLLLAACASDDSGAADTTSAPAAATTELSTTTTTIPAEPSYSEAGPYPVGVATLQLASGESVEVWYPAVEGSTGSETYDIRDFVPEGIRAILVGDVPSTFTYDAARDAAVADGAFPLVLFSHGFSGMRLQSTFLTAHLASWGMVVASTDHPSRDLENVLGGTMNSNRSESIADLLATLELVVADPTVGPHVDAEQIAAVGHSAGGGTVLGAASDPRIDGYVSLASGALGTSDLSQPAELPNKPSFFIAGSVDEVVTVEETTRPAFEAAPSPSLLWVLEGVGHNGFDDFCTFGGGTGIIGVAEASGLGALLDANASLRRLGEDGCKPPATPVAETFPIIQHAVTAWLRQLFGIDPNAPGLDGSEIVTVQSR